MSFNLAGSLSLIVPACGGLGRAAGRPYRRRRRAAAYLPLYLRQIVEQGYDEAPFERDARAHELDA